MCPPGVPWGLSDPLCSHPGTVLAPVTLLQGILDPVHEARSSSCLCGSSNLWLWCS